MTGRADITALLGQMQAIKSQVQQGVQPATMGSIGQQIEGVNKSEFSDLLKMAVDSVNDQQMSAKKMAEAYERGDPNIDLPQVMIGLQKASVSFEAMTQVRNRLVSAYEEIARMPI